MATLQDLRERYATASDDEVQDAVDAGQAAYSPDAWLVITDEAGRRGLSQHDRVEAGGSPLRASAQRLLDRATAVFESVPSVGLSPAAAEGRKQIQAVAVVTLLMSVVFVVAAIALLGAVSLLQPVITLALTAALCVNLLEGRVWARWLMAFVLSAMSVNYAHTLLRYGYANPPTAAVLAVSSVAYAIMALVLIFSRGVRAFFNRVV
jgi:hypothetical protein